jgi:hypothetical protein
MFGQLHFSLPQQRHDVLRVVFLHGRSSFSLD